MNKTELSIAGICCLVTAVYVAPMRTRFLASNGRSYEFAVIPATSYAAPQTDANLSGTWTLTITTPPDASAQGGARGAVALRQTLTVKQDGSKITGTLGGGRGPGTPLQGTVSANTVTWTVSRRLADGVPRDVRYKATVSGDTMTGSIAEPTVDPTQAYTDQFTAKRNVTQ